MTSSLPRPVGRRVEWPFAPAAPTVSARPVPLPPAVQPPARPATPLQILLNRSLYGLLGLPFGLAWFIIFMTALSASFGLMFVLVGFPMLALVLLAASGVSYLERALILSWFGETITSPVRHRDPGIAGFVLGPFRDTSRWRELLFVVLRLPFGVASFVVVVAAWTFPLFALSSIIWGWSASFGFWTVLLFGSGIASLVIGPAFIYGFTELQLVLARTLLGPSPSELTERTRRVVQSRDRSVEAAEAERRRIERDLHDGAQARLATVALDLGRARRRLEQGDSADEVGAIIATAHEDAKAAIVELRDLARGIHPAVLSDRGLDAALADVAVRCTVPVHVDVGLSARPPAHIESTAYFAVSELLTNVTRHSGARNAWVTIRGDADQLLIDVSDDGVGGVDRSLGSGVSGLEDRIEAVDGSMTVRSPLGEGTTVLIEIPSRS